MFRTDYHSFLIFVSKLNFILSNTRHFKYDYSNITFSFVYDLENSKYHSFLLYDSSCNNNSNQISINDLDYSKLCLLQEGHCLRTQVQRICDLTDQCANKEENFEFESGSMDSLLRITKARKGKTPIRKNTMPLSGINVTRINKPRMTKLPSA